METKACSRCKTSKTLDQFYPRRGRIGKYTAWCKACYAISRVSPETKAKERAWRERNREKISSRRKRAYWKNPEAARAKTRAYFVANPHVSRRNALKRRGLTVEQFNTMLAIQRQRCMLCGQEFSTSDRALKPVVDHDHQTGEVRGILHNNCNSGLGFFGDSATRLQMAINYLGIFK